ncbi:unnamed protein product [Brassica oleracea]
MMKIRREEGFKRMIVSGKIDGGNERSTGSWRRRQDLTGRSFRSRWRRRHQGFWETWDGLIWR